jgi:transposase-like protein
MADLRLVYQAATREAAEAQLRQLNEKWSDKYAIAIRSWQNNWEDLAAFFAYPAEIRRLIYTTKSVEGYHRQLRKVTKSKGAFPCISSCTSGSASNRNTPEISRPSSSQRKTSLIWTILRDGQLD